jgi:shikimate dehydrogenase
VTERTRLAVLGSPIAHSKSPAIHRAAYAALGLEWSYDAVEVTGFDLAHFVASLDDEWRGLSLTMPLKRDVVPLLTWSDPVVALVRGANTVVLSDDEVRGYNTDVRGITHAFAEAGVDSLASVQVLGAGATAASVLVGVAQLGATRVTFAARTPEKAQQLVDLGTALGVEVIVRSWGFQDRSLIIPDAVISTVPGGESDLVFAEEIRRSAVLFDVAYDPWPSGLATAWSSVGGTVISGFDLLVHQAIGQVRLFLTGDAEQALPDESRVLDAMRAAL